MTKAREHLLFILSSKSTRMSIFLTAIYQLIIHRVIRIIINRHSFAKKQNAPRLCGVFCMNLLKSSSILKPVSLAFINYDDVFPPETAPVKYRFGRNPLALYAGDKVYPCIPLRA